MKCLQMALIQIDVSPFRWPRCRDIILLIILMFLVLASSNVAAITPTFKQVILDDAIVAGFQCDSTNPEPEPDAVALGDVNELLYPAQWHTFDVDFNGVVDARVNGGGSAIDSTAGSMCIGRSVFKQLQYYLGDQTRYNDFVNSTASGRADDDSGIISRVTEGVDASEATIGFIVIRFNTGMRLKFTGVVSGGAGNLVLTVSTLDDVKPADALWFSEALATSRNKKRSRFTYAFNQSLRVDNIFSPITEGDVFVDLLGTPTANGVPVGWSEALPYLARINLLDSYYDETTRALVSVPKVYFQCEFSTCPTQGRGKWFDKNGTSYNLGVGQITKAKESTNTTDLKLHFLHTGQGNCVVMECPNPDKALVVDCGTARSDKNRETFLKNTKGKFGAQPRGVLEAINILKDKTEIDLVVTHGDTDHFNKLDSILYTRNLTAEPIYDRVNNIYFGGDYEVGFPKENIAKRPKVFKEKYDKATERGSTRIFANTGTVLSGDSAKATDRITKSNIYSCGNAPADPVIQIVAVNDHPEDNKDKNANSIVMYIEYKQKTIVLPGDAELDGLLRSIGYRRCRTGDAGCVNSLGLNSRTLQFFNEIPTGEPAIPLTGAGGKANIDILAVPHHGAVTLGSNSQFWINKINPKYLVYSHGNHNHGHPYGGSYFATVYDGSLYKTSVSPGTANRSANVTVLATEAYTGTDAAPTQWPVSSNDFGYFHSDSQLAMNRIAAHVMRFNSSKQTRIYIDGEITNKGDYGKRRLVDSRVYSTEQLGSHTFTISDDGSGEFDINVTCNGIFNALDRGRTDVVNPELCARGL